MGKCMLSATTTTKKVRILKTLVGLCQIPTALLRRWDRKYRTFLPEDLNRRCLGKMQSS
jgi:hypothetical protein